ncbi:cell envelope integrity protein CreD [uncultured Pseudoteredinibacter sp.]|uniref:cell envelope integrity protein CreD n=1 Tax=uncultured Pseudoteredinibacter sp. TaxID=1641701 RepID=UPI00262A33AF|nr:cell envelope integrity protein CreD [uncultured Pseudoteredinibacter sp.]
MFRSPSFKLLLLLFLFLLLVIPITMVQHKTEDRSRSQSQAQFSVAQHWTGKQWLGSPVIAIPYQTKAIVQNNGYSAASRQLWAFVPAKEASLNAELSVEKRKKGIYEIPVYRSRFQIQGYFQTEDIASAMEKLAADPSVDHIGQAILSLSFADMRGLEQQSLDINGQTQSFEVGSKLKNLSQGLHHQMANLIDTEKSKKIDFAVSLQLKGMSEIYYLPLAQSNTFSLQANWPHPKFMGAQLPLDYKIEANSFSANWHSNHFALDNLGYIESCLKQNNCAVLERKNRLLLGVDFINPVDIYLKTERAIKYAFLLIGLSFMVFYIIEHIKGLSMHPIQYAFVGLAIAIFYLLLLALAEHIGFAFAYLLSTVACSALLYGYLKRVLKNQALTLSFSAGIVSLWALLYIIIQAEDFALLMGSILVFALLSALMLGTRNIDWYSLGQTNKSPSDDKPN